MVTPSPVWNFSSGQVTHSLFLRHKMLISKQMTQLLEDFLKQKEDWRLKISPDMQRIIDEYAAMEKHFDEILGLLDPYYPDLKDNTKFSQEMSDAFYPVMDAIERRIVRFILDESEPIKPKTEKEA